MKINRLAAAGVLSLAASGALVALSAPPASAYALGTVSASKTTNLVDNEVITVTFSGFTGDSGPPDTVYIVECTPAVVSSGGDTSYCDQSDPTSPTQSPTVPEHVVKVTSFSNGTGTAQFTVHTGADWLGTHKGAACGAATGACYIVATDGQTAATTTWAGFTSVTFKDTRAKTTTAVKAKKSAKANSKVALTATTKGTGSTKPTGTVVFKDNGKKIASVKESASGKTTTKVKIKKGTNKITAAYSGDTNYQPSTGKATITGKK